MKRPIIINFFSIITGKGLSISAFVSKAKNCVSNDIPSESTTAPIESYRQLGSNKYILKINFIDKKGEILKKKVFETDSLGNIYIKYPLKENERSSLNAIEIYEISYSSGIEFYLGSFIPIKSEAENKVIICDFDKTLVDTKYSNTLEVFNSLTKPITDFPKVIRSIEILKEHIVDKYHPFILSASPLFYSDAISNWLYQNAIYTAGVFLKDFRKLFSVLDKELTFKDLSGQGSYKLGQLLSIIDLTDLPDELVLVGDNFESDPIIYQILAKFLMGDISASMLLKDLKNRPEFKLNKKQQSILLNKLFRIEDNLKRKEKPIKIKILIRKYDKDTYELLDNDTHMEKLIETYSAN